MVNIEAIKTEVEKLTPNGYRIDEEVFSRLTAVAEFFTWLSSRPEHSGLTMDVRKSVLKTDGWLRVESDHLDLWNKEIKHRFYDALEKAGNCEIYSVTDGEIVMDISFDELYVVKDGWIDEEFIREKIDLAEKLKDLILQNT